MMLSLNDVTQYFQIVLRGLKPQPPNSNGLPNSRTLYQRLDAVNVLSARVLLGS